MYNILKIFNEILKNRFLSNLKINGSVYVKFEFRKTVQSNNKQFCSKSFFDCSEISSLLNLEYEYNLSNTR